MYKTVVIASLQYGCETWTLYGKQLKTIDQFILRCLHKIMDIAWEDKPSNTEVLRRANIPGTEALIVKAQLQWVGRVVRMDDARLPKMVFFQSDHLCTEHWTPTKEAQRRSEGIPRTVHQSQSWMGNSRNRPHCLENSHPQGRSRL